MTIDGPNSGGAPKLSYETGWIVVANGAILIIVPAARRPCAARNEPAQITKGMSAGTLAA